MQQNPHRGAVRSSHIRESRELLGILTEVKRQGIKPVFSMEYEYHFTMRELAQCVAYFDKVAADLIGN